jgi:hypothetical protein
MAGRLRLGPASSPKALGVVAAAVLVVALVLTGRFLNPGSGGRPPAGANSAQRATISSQAPHRIAGKVDCPPAWPVLAMSNHASYPAGHPARPPASATPVACYQTAAQAASAGYAPAPLPPGALEVGGVYLTPPSRRFQASCQPVADRLGFAVPCPGLLPTSVPDTAPQGLCEASVACRRGRLLAFAYGGFVVPFGYVGAAGATPPWRSSPCQPVAGPAGSSCGARMSAGSPRRWCTGSGRCWPPAPMTPRRCLAAGCWCAGRSGARSSWSPHQARMRSTSGWSLPWPTTCAWSDPDADRTRMALPARRAAFDAGSSAP